MLPEIQDCNICVQYLHTSNGFVLMKTANNKHLGKVIITLTAYF